MITTADIDIDFKDRNDAIKILGGTPAAIINETTRKHNTGMYYNAIPVDPITGIASIDHNVANDRGYFKLDFLNLGVYDRIKDEAHINKLIAIEPNWKRLTTDSDFVTKLIHIGNYFSLLAYKKPASIEEMAMMLAIIRPGKKHLQNYSWDQIRETVWDITDTDGYAFKKAHSVSYAMAVAINMNLIEEEENENTINT